MKKEFLLLLAISLAFFSGCSKFDLASWLHKPGKQHCSVQQFNSGFVNAMASPYLFSKTYDAMGVPKTMDAYVLGIFPGQRRFNMKLVYKGAHIYFFDVNSGDTLMDVTLNNKGRPVVAVEMPNFYQGQPQPFSPMRHEFFYTGNRLSGLKTIRPFFTSNYTFAYDAYGNIVSTNMGDNFVYDYTKKADRQFYMDVDLYGPYLPGFRLLQYLEAFPEITSPQHIRTSHTNTIFSLFDLFDHQLDSKKKLVAYKGTNSPGSPGNTVSFSIIWKCK